MRLSSIRVKNFRVLRDVAIPDLPKILGVWGRNSSGKSAIVHAVVATANAVRSRGGGPNTQPFNVGGLQLGDWTKILWRGGTEQSSGEITIDFKEPDVHTSFRFGSGTWQPPDGSIPAGLVRYFPLQRSMVGRSHEIQHTPSGDLGVNPGMLHPFVHYYLHERMRDRITQGRPNEVEQIDQWLTRFGLGRLSDHTRGSSVTSTFTDPETSFPTDLTDGGFGGVSIAPVVVEALSFRDGVVLVEEPELSLHPAAQAELLDFFLEVAENRGHQIIFTSHSTYLLGRIVRYLRDNPSASTSLINVGTMRKDSQGAHYSVESTSNLVARFEQVQPLLSDLHLRWPA